MAGFSLRTSMSNRSFNYEDVDSEGVVLDGPVEDVVEQLETAEAEESNAVEVAALDTAITEGENADVVADDIDETIADGEAVVEAADEEAATSGDEPAIAPEDVAVMQEKVRTFLKFVPGDGITFALSRESVRDDGYNAFKMNLEGLREMGEKVKKFLKDVWKKICDGFDKVINFIKQFLPTKLNRLRWLLKEFNKTDLSKAMKKGDEAYKKANENFKKTTLKNHLGAAILLGTNLEDCDKLLKAYIAQMTVVIEVVKKNLDVRNKDDAADFAKALNAGYEALMKKAEVSSILSAYPSLKVDPVKEAREALSDTVVRAAGVTNIYPSGKNVVYTICANVTKESREDEDSDDTYYVTQVVKAERAVKESDVKDPNFDPEVTKRNISTIVQNADQFTSVSEKLNKAIKDFRKDVVDSNGGNMFTNFWAGRQAEKALRRLISSEISVVTKWNGDILTYATSYGRAVLTAYNAGKVRKEAKDNK